MSANLGKTLLIANPTANNKRGISAALYAGDILREALPEGDFDLVMTESVLHGKTLAAQAGAYDSVLALGGDGLVHEVLNGLMELSKKDRPVFGLLPSGTGNDYARTLNMSFDIAGSVAQIQKAKTKMVDVGICNGEYFAETLSFGLDAAIALDTVERRKRTGKTGARLFFESGIDMLLHHRNTYNYQADLEGAEHLHGQMLLFVVQIGKTYGGGFTICPEAKIDDGCFDICIARAPLGLVKATTIFLLSKNAHHTRFKDMQFHKTDHLTVSFEGQELPIQIDGESFKGLSFDIRCLPQAFKVLIHED